MKFIAGGLNGVYLQEIAEHAISKTQHVQIAVSYASNDPILFRICIENNIKVEFWCRYDQ